MSFTYLIFIGSFSHQFDSLGTFYYWAPNVNPSSGYSMRGVIDVVALESETMTVEAVWNKFTGTFRFDRCLFE